MQQPKILPPVYRDIKRLVLDTVRQVVGYKKNPQETSMKKTTKATVAALVLLASTSTWAACNANMAITRPDARYTDHGNGTVTDKQTGLVWMQCSQGLSGTACGTGTITSMNWKQALEAAQAANGGTGTFGYTDWRLPTIAELRTLVEQACYNPAINTTLFPATLSGRYFSASPAAAGGGNASVVNFFEGVERSAESKNNNSLPFYVRLVRGGN